MNSVKPIKPFKTIEEEAKFWDTHDISPLLAKTASSLNDLPLLESSKEESLTVRLQTSIKKRLTSIASQKGINPSTLARMWIIERVQSTKT